jgi:hypothetical protein
MSNNSLWMSNIVWYQNEQIVSKTFEYYFILQAILKNPEHEDRETAAAIEIQRVYRGYMHRYNQLIDLYYY